MGCMVLCVLTCCCAFLRWFFAGTAAALALKLFVLVAIGAIVTSNTHIIFVSDISFLAVAALLKDELAVIVGVSASLAVIASVLKGLVYATRVGFWWASRFEHANIVGVSHIPSLAVTTRC